MLHGYRAIRENVFGHASFVQQRTSGMLVRELNGALLVDSGLPSDTFNKVLWEGGASLEAGKKILQGAADWFAGKRSGELLLPGLHLPPATERPFSVWAGAEDEAGLNRDCVFFGQNGYTSAEHETGMVLPLDRWTPPETFLEGLRIIPATNAAALFACAEVIADNWTPPDEAVKTFYKCAEGALFAPAAPMRLFVGMLGERPVASGEYFLSDGGNTVGLHMICTRKVFRGQGIGTAMTAALLSAGRKTGASQAVLLASEAGRGLYARQGFEACGRFVEYVLGDELLF